MDGKTITITSAANARVKDAVRLRDGTHRRKQGLMIIEGSRELAAALAAGHPLQDLYVCDELPQAPQDAEIEATARSRGATVIACNEGVMRKLSYRGHPGALLGIAPRIQALALADVTPPKSALLLIVDAVEKPGNLGTILRTAEAAGVDGLILSRPGTDPSNPNVVRASIGTVFHVPLMEAPVDELQPWLQARGITTVVASPEAETLYTSSDLRGSIALLVGSEADGVSEDWKAAAPQAVRIPMRGRHDSLNVAAASAVLLFEAVRQRSA